MHKLMADHAMPDHYSAAKLSMAASLKTEIVLLTREARRRQLLATPFDIEASWDTIYKFWPSRSEVNTILGRGAEDGFGES